MAGPLHLLRCVAKAAANALGGGFAGDLLFEALPEMAGNAWKWWKGDRSSDQLRDELAQLALANPGPLREHIRDIVREVAAEQSSAQQRELELYLSLIPGQIRKSLRSPADPGGTTVPHGLPLDGPNDLLPLLPTRLPRFQPGDRPLPSVDWQLQELLGMGGFGEVWKAINPLMASAPPVALKFCLDAEAASFLRNEAVVLDRIMRHGRHPGIVPLLHTYLSAETPCLEYEYLNGGDLAGLIRDWHRGDNRPSALDISRVLHQIAGIVAFAHCQSPPIVHRDLKPANILIQQGTAGTLQIRITDFGIGSVAGAQVRNQATRSSTQGYFLATALRGACTPLYASPQQMRGDPADPRDDVHALGVIWYQMLLGDLTAGRPGGTRWQRRLRDMGLDSQLVDLLNACLEDDPADRLADASVLTNSLSELLTGRKSDDVQAVIQAKVARFTSSLQEINRPSRPRLSESRLDESSSRDLHQQRLELDRQVATRPTDADLLVRRADLHRLLGQYDLAIRDCTEALRHAPELARAFATRGSCHRLRGLLELAIADCNEAIRLDARCVLAYFNRGEALRLCRQLDRAIADFTTALTLDPTYAWAYGSRGAARQQKGDLTGSLADLDETLRLLPGYAWAYLVRAETQRLRGNLDQAIADSNAALNLQPDAYMALATRGAALRQKGAFFAAIADLQRVLDMQPDYQWARDQLELARRRRR